MVLTFNVFLLKDISYTGLTRLPPRLQNKASHFAKLIIRFAGVQHSYISYSLESQKLSVACGRARKGSNVPVLPGVLQIAMFETLHGKDIQFIP